MKSQHKIVDKKEFLKKVKDWQASGLKVVFTNGCFDILHPGHVDLLERSGEFGEKLVVALNTDNSVSRLKGELRPINDQKFRGQMLASLECIDLVTFFDEDTPIELIRQSKPDVLVKGSDYEVIEIVGAPEVQSYGGEVKTVSLLPGYSTTSLIERIKRKTKA